MDFFFELLIFIVAMVGVVLGARWSTKFAAALAASFRISKYAVGLIVIAFISILPETLIGINAALAGVPEFGLGTLFGSNVADLTLVFALVVWFADRGLRIESSIVKHFWVYSLFLLLPLVLGLNGHFSRLEGVALVVAGLAFYLLSLRHDKIETVVVTHPGGRWKNFFGLLLGMLFLLVGAHFTVEAGVSIAGFLGVSPILVGLLVVGLGTTMPELFFSMGAVRRHDDSLAVGDILGTVLADATIVVGILALISPFDFPVKIIYITGGFMFAASILLFYFMRSQRILSRKEAMLLFLFWVLFVMTEFSFA